MLRKEDSFFSILLLVDIMGDQNLRGFPAIESIAPESQVDGIRDRPFGSPCTCTTVVSLITVPELYPITRGAYATTRTIAMKKPVFSRHERTPFSVEKSESISKETFGYKPCRRLSHFMVVLTVVVKLLQ